jgi:lysozyme family protein
MADFEQSFQRLMKDEGFVLSDHPADKGGLTYAGISQKFHPKWSGWSYVDLEGGVPPTYMVRDFYRAEYWCPVMGDEIVSQRVADVVFSQFVNMGGNAIKLMQKVLGVTADGAFGPKTLAALNAMDEERFLALYCIANVARYHAIGMKDKTQRVWWPGWIARALRITE